MFSKVISQIARFLKDYITSTKQALEVIFVPLGDFIVHFNDSMPLLRYTFELLFGTTIVFNVFKIQIITELLLQLLLSRIVNDALVLWLYHLWSWYGILLDLLCNL